MRWALGGGGGGGLISDHCLSAYMKDLLLEMEELARIVHVSKGRNHLTNMQEVATITNLLKVVPGETAKAKMK